jgi:hypothetical protein
MKWFSAQELYRRGGRWLFRGVEHVFFSVVVVFPFFGGLCKTSHDMKQNNGILMDINGISLGD